MRIIANLLLSCYADDTHLYTIIIKHWLLHLHCPHLGFRKTFSSTCHSYLQLNENKSIVGSSFTIKTYFSCACMFVYNNSYCDFSYWSDFMVNSHYNTCCFPWTWCISLYIMFCRWRDLLCFHGKLHLAMRISSRYRRRHPLDSCDNRKCSGPLLLSQPRPALASG